MDVCFVSHSSQKGGSERSLLELLEGLVKDGVLCHALLPENGPIEADLKRLSVPYTVIPYRWWILGKNEDRQKAIEEIAQQSIFVTEEIRRLNPRIIYSNTSVINIGAIAAEELGISHIWHIREYGEQDHSLSFILEKKERFEYISRNSKFVIFNSHAIKEYYSSCADFKSSAVIYNNVSVREVAHNRKDLFTNKNSLHVIVVGMIQEGKGQKDAILAIKELKKEGYDVELAIIGNTIDVKYEEECRNIVEEESLDDRVHIIGYLDNAFPAMQESDAVLVCSRNEAFGRVSIEAMLAGKPVIGTNRGGTVELITDGVTGLLYEPGDYQQLKEKIKVLIDNPGKRRKMGEEGYKFVIGRFSQDKYSRKSKDIIDMCGDKESYTYMYSVFTLAKINILKRGLEDARIKIEETDRAIQQKDHELHAIRAANSAEVEALRSELAEAYGALNAKSSEVEALYRKQTTAEVVRKRVWSELERCRAEIDKMRRTRWWRIAVRLSHIKRKLICDYLQHIYWLLSCQLNKRAKGKRFTELISQSNLFDTSYYLESNPDVAGAGINPLEHYLTWGAAEGRDPNPLFDTSYYLESNPDVAGAGINPLEHYLTWGAAEGRDPNPLFDTSYYLESNPDVAGAGINPLEHYLTWGAAEGRDPNPLFDTSYYLESNPDVAGAGINPLEHYLTWGAAEGRDPNPLFDTSYYLEHIPFSRQNIIETDAIIKERDLLLQQREELVHERKVLLQEKEALVKEIEHKKSFSELFLSPWTDAWKTFYLNNCNNIQYYLDNLKAGMDDESREVIDTLWEKIIFLIPYNKYKQSYLYKIDAFLTTQEVEEQTNHIIPKQYKFPEGVNFETSIFFTKNGLSFLPENITSQITNKAVIDGGAYIGDSALAFIEYNPAKIYSFEPCDLSYRKLKETITLNKVENLIESIKLGLSDERKDVPIYGNNNGASLYMPDVNERSTISTVTIDDFVSDKNINVGLIKLDVEGSELEVVNGALKTIQKDKPILLISIYHRPEDFFYIKPIIDKLDLGYTFMVRKTSPFRVTSETVLIGYVD
ncbi:MAG: FkbM family methyltransferase [Syntrophobacteraceae bacterium]